MTHGMPHDEHCKNHSFLFFLLCFSMCYLLLLFFYKKENKIKEICNELLLL